MRSFKDLPLKNKLLYYFLPISILPLIVFALIVAQMYSNTFERRTVDNILDNSTLITNQVEAMMKDIVSCSNTLTFNINTVFEDYEQKELFNPMQRRLDLTNILYNANIIYPSADAIAFMDTGGMLYASDQRLNAGYTKLYTSDMLKSLAQTTGKSVWFEMEARDYLTTESGKPVITLGKKIINIKSGKTLGYVFINLTEEKLKEAFSPQKIEYEIVKNNQVISSFDQDRLFSTVEIPSFPSDGYKFYNKSPVDKVSYVYTYYKFSDLNWILVGRTPLKDLKSDIESTMVLLTAIVLLCIVLELISVNIFSKSINKPFDYMIRQMKSIGKGNFDLSLEIQTKDEIGVFALTFNKMSRKIKRLMEDVEFEARKKREYELALLQEQVRPHFLYNTLDTIYALNDMGLKRDAGKAIKALADFYRTTLSNGAETITIKEEISALQEYLYLMKLQYDDAFDYRLELDPEIQNCETIKLLLQPLVENAIYHGLKPLSQKGLLVIKASKKENTVHFEIIDNGVGVSETFLNEILSYQHDDQKTHFGLFTVKDRLKLYYGDASTFVIKSEKNIGTQVAITIPMREERTKNYD